VDFRPALKFFDCISYKKWAKLGESVRAGAGRLAVSSSKAAREEEIFSKGVESFTSGDAHALPLAYDFSRHRRVLDLGGGTGSFLLPTLDRYSSLECTLFEFPPAAHVARQRLARPSRSQRIRITQGDMFRDAIPEGHDACILAHVLHTLSIDHILETLANLRKSMGAGARLLFRRHPHGP
jgi:hypothetical protein